MKIKPYYCLSEQDKEIIRQERIKKNYHYKKGKFTADETYYYNIYLNK